MKKNSEVHSFEEVLKWLAENRYVPFKWNQPVQCDLGDFAGRHESIKTDSGWIWAKRAE